MVSLDSPDTPRRGFFGRLLSGLAAAAVGGSLSPELARGASGVPAASGEWDDSWTKRLTGTHKQVFDSPEIAEGSALHQSRTFMKHYAEMYGTSDADTNAVIVVRHEAIPIVLQDAMWERYGLAKDTKLKDPTTGKSARRNPFLNAKADDKYALVWADGGLDTLLSRGVIVLACNLALMGMSDMVRKKDGGTEDEAKAKLIGGLVPGVIRMPSGIFAVIRAEEAGCNYIRAG